MSMVFDTHKLIEQLIKGGMSKEAAETVIYGIDEAVKNNAATKTDLQQVESNLLHEITEIKSDIGWIKRAFFVVGVAVTVAALKYIFAA
ncbi:hypothetical protein [Photobacterium halotolerans]|uniref:hypothetical protein n=1 Tax=Photobacterium halotolerans TaxID=265726 RepID=UPI0003F6714F|nr:hypothetical protein [Photobacterium halotolerans]